MKKIAVLFLALTTLASAEAARCYKQSDVQYENRGTSFLSMGYQERIVVGRHLNATPEVVWDYISNPDLINKWGTPRVRMFDTAEMRSYNYGPKALPYFEHGAVREAKVPVFPGKPLSPKLTLHEMLCETRAPYYQQYKIIKGTGFKEHLGQITVKSYNRDTSVLEWTIDFTPTTERVPGLGLATGKAMSAFLENQLNISLDNLGELLNEKR